jgi:D-sedoheptulose 7-phosphate isomerase
MDKMKESTEFFQQYLIDTNASIMRCDYRGLALASDRISMISAHGGKIILAGNGGSAAMASHVSVDLTKTAKIRAVNFNESDLITCFANDYGYENWVAEAIDRYADKIDGVILVSSSGESMNIINGALKTKQLGLPLVTLSGFKANNRLRSLGDINLWCDSEIYNIVEMTHHVWLLSIVEYVASSHASCP